MGGEYKFFPFSYFVCVGSLPLSTCCILALDVLTQWEKKTRAKMAERFNAGVIGLSPPVELNTQSVTFSWTIFFIAFPSLKDQ